MATTVMVRKFDVRKTRKGDNFATLRLNLGREGDFLEIDAKIWGLEQVLAGGREQPRPGDMLRVEYKTDEYQGRAQWVIQKFERIDGAERERALDQFVPPERIDRAFYRRRLDELIDATSPDRVSGQALREIYDRSGFLEAFFLAPAARVHHQNYPGGLLEHTVNVTALALALADAYAQPGAGREGLTFNSQPLPIDREVLIAAGLLHDIGKLDTYRFEPLPEVTDAQSWEGHLTISYAQVRRVAEPMLAEPPYAEAIDELNKLLHCILSHHGSLEYGSPVTPACAEAFLLAQADMTDARLAEIASGGADALKQNPETRWLPRQMHFPGGIFVGDWPPQETS